MKTFIISINRKLNTKISRKLITMIGSLFGVRFGNVTVDGRLQIVQCPVQRHNRVTDRRHRRVGRIVHRKVDGVPCVRNLESESRE